ncbi:MAG: hypothetical protein U5L72_07455 [Bacteroidales bacterium]|nr:hypothetical protein [Bacteroidales bacterium]
MGTWTQQQPEWMETPLIVTEISGKSTHGIGGYVDVMRKDTVKETKNSLNGRASNLANYLKICLSFIF